MQQTQPNPADFVRIIRTMNNMLIIGQVQRTNTEYLISEPLSITPTEEGIRIAPVDSVLIGDVVKLLELEISKVFYSVIPEKVFIDEYFKTLEKIKNPPKSQTQESQESQKS